MKINSDIGVAVELLVGTIGLMLVVVAFLLNLYALAMIAIVITSIGYGMLLHRAVSSG